MHCDVFFEDFGPLPKTKFPYLKTIERQCFWIVRKIDSIKNKSKIFLKVLQKCEKGFDI